MNKPYRYISFGAGVQSTALLMMSALELRGCPRADVAIFADTQDEPPWVYENLWRMTEWARPHGLEIHIASAGCLSDDMRKRHDGLSHRWASIPAFTLGDDGRASMLRRQCTREYKIEVIEREIRRLMGYQPRQRIHGPVKAFLGISIDEADRVKPSRTKWITTQYPLIEAGMSRGDCEKLILSMGLQSPKKSACRFCPYHDDGYWMDLKTTEPETFEAACRDDDTIRDMSRGGIKRPLFLHRSLIPLRDVEFKPKIRNGQLDLDFWFSNECDGICGV
jgi:hypothetical protein